MSEKKGTSHKNQLSRLNRIAGQVNGVVKMVEDQRYCIDILTQIKAIKSALGSVERTIIDEHIQHCVHKAIKSKKTDDSNRMLDEVRQLLRASKV